MTDQLYHEQITDYCSEKLSKGLFNCSRTMQSQGHHLRCNVFPDRRHENDMDICITELQMPCFLSFNLLQTQSICILSFHSIRSR